MRIRTRAVISALIIVIGSAIAFFIMWVFTSGIYDLEYYLSDEIDGRHSPYMSALSKGEPRIHEALYEENTLHVRYLYKKHCIDGSTKYVFEVIEWLNSNGTVDTSTKTVSFYSEAYPLKYKSRVELYGINYGFTYEVGKEYVIIAPDNTLSYEYMYMPLEDLTKMSDTYESALEMELDIDVSGMDKEAFLQVLRDWIAENK